MAGRKGGRRRRALWTRRPSAKLKSLPGPVARLEAWVLPRQLLSSSVWPREGPGPLSRGPFSASP